VVTAALDDVAHYNMAAGGDASSNWFESGGTTFLGTTAMSLTNKMRAALFSVATDMVFGYGHNDIFNGVTPTLYLNRANAFFTRSDLFEGNGGPTSGKRIQWTLTPKTTKEAGASWATITDAQQTVVGGIVSGVSVNAASVNTQLFATPTAWGATALLDMATLSRSPDANGLYWDDGDKTSDGTHLGVGMTPASTALTNLGPWTSRSSGQETDEDDENMEPDAIYVRAVGSSWTTDANVVAGDKVRLTPSRADFNMEYWVVGSSAQTGNGVRIPPEGRIVTVPTGGALQYRCLDGARELVVEVQNA
jgi:hypothetical protein